MHRYKQDRRIIGLVAALRAADQIADEAFIVADGIAAGIHDIPGNGILKENDARTEGALAEYETAITARAYVCPLLSSTPWTTQRIPQKALMRSRKVDECKPLDHGLGVHRQDDVYEGGTAGGRHGRVH